MNNNGKAIVLGFALLAVVFVLYITAFATIEPFKEFLDVSRNSTSLNCPGTTGFNQTDYNNDTDFQKLVKRPTCFVTGITMIYFIGAFLIAVAIWLVNNWRKLAK